MQYNSEVAWLAHLFCLPLCYSLFPEIQNAAVIPQAGSQQLIYVSMMSFFLWAAKQICIDVMFFNTLESQLVGLNALLIIPSRDGSVNDLYRWAVLLFDAIIYSVISSSMELPSTASAYSHTLLGSVIYINFVLYAGLHLPQPSF